MRSVSMLIVLVRSDVVTAVVGLSKDAQQMERDKGAEVRSFSGADREVLTIYLPERWNWEGVSVFCL